MTPVHRTIELSRTSAGRVSACARVQQCYSVRGLRDQLFQAEENVRRYEKLIVFDVVKTGLTISLSREVGDVR